MGVGGQQGAGFRSPGTVLGNEFGTVTQLSTVELETNLISKRACRGHVGRLCCLLQ